MVKLVGETTGTAVYTISFQWNKLPKGFLIESLSSSKCIVTESLKDSIIKDTPGISPSQSIVISAL